MNLRLPAGVRWSGMLLSAVAISVVALIIVVTHGIPLLMALFRPSVKIEAVDTTTPLLSAADSTHALYRQRFEGRSLFFRPPAWKLIPPPPPPPPPPQPPAPPPPPPVEYSGMRPVGMLGPLVYFEGGRSVEVGKESEGVTVVEIVSPWALKLRHKGKLYDVQIGQSVNDSIFRPLGSAPTPSGITVARPEAGAASGGSSSSADNSAGAAGDGPASAGASRLTPKAGDGAAAGATSTPAAGAGTPASTPGGAAEAAPGAASGAESGAESTAPGPLQAQQAVTPPPPPLTAAQIARMDMAAARIALDRIATAKGLPGLDQATASRLDTEQDLLLQRIESLK